MATQQISHKDVRTERHTYIGASDIGVIMGVSPFKTPFQLWCEKTQRVQLPDLEKTNESVRMGIVLEEFIAQEYAHRNNVQVRRAPKVYVHPDYPFIRAHADRLVTGTEKGLECKNTSEYNADKWKGADIPETYILQCQMCMGLSGKKEWDIAALIGGNKYKDKPLKFDPELFEMMIEKAVEFWNENVLKDIPPALTDKDDDAMKDLYKEDNGNIINLSEASAETIDDFDSLVAQRQELNMHKTEIDKEIKELDAQIKDVIKENQGVKTQKYKVTWKNQIKNSVDTEKLKADGIYENYLKETSYRVLRITNNKESEVQ